MSFKSFYRRKIYGFNQTTMQRKVAVFVTPLLCMCFMVKVAQCYFNKYLLSSNSSHVWMWELDCEEGWAPKNGCFWTGMLEKTLESPLDYKEIQPVNPKGNHSWIFTGRTDAETETPILWPPDVKNRLIGKDPDAGKDWRREKKGMTEDEMLGWHHQHDRHEFE